jgi:hypothetical protein
VVVALDDRTVARTSPEPARGKGVRHELRRRPVTVRAGAPVGRLGRDARRQARGLVAVEEHIGGQALLDRRWPALEREHRQEQGQERRHERRAVYPRLNQGGSTYNPGG